MTRVFKPKDCAICGDSFTPTGSTAKYCGECGGEVRREKARERERKYREDNPDKILKGRRKYREANRDKARESNRRYYAAHRERVLEYRRAYYAANREKELEQQRNYRRKAADAAQASAGNGAAQ